MLDERPAKILVVDDEACNRKLLTALLKAQHYDVHCISSAATTLDALAEYEPDVVLLDVMMPDMDGYEVVAGIKTQEQFQHIPVIMLTALNDADSRIRGLNAGAEDFLSKPIDGRELNVRIRNLVRLKKLNDFMRHNVGLLANYDALTGLPNPSLFQAQVQQQLAHARENDRELALLALEINNFEFINESFGYTSGDLVIQAISERLKASLGEDSLIARGRTTFSIILEQSGSLSINERVENIRNALVQPFLVAETKLFLTANFGLSVFPADGEDPDVLLNQAEIAMRRARTDSGNTVLYYQPQMNAAGRERFRLEADLRKALECGELLLHYQPKVKLNDGEVIGLEALIRWQHSTQGLVPPGQFIPLAEQSGLICPLGEWALSTACLQNKIWQEAGGRAVPVSVNISPLEFQDAKLAERVSRVLQESGLKAHQLELEVTESSTMRNLDYSIDVLQEFRKLGVQIAIDDFGTGHSSLAYLRHFPLNTLKIDQSFVRDVPHNPDACAIVRAIIGLGRSLRLKVLAEGIETMEQLSFLRQEGCQLGQGYYFSRPLPVDEVEAFLMSDIIHRTGDA